MVTYKFSFVCFFQGRQELDWDRPLRFNQRPLGNRAVAAGRHGIPGIRPDVLQPWRTTMARTKGRHEETEGNFCTPTLFMSIRIAPAHRWI